MKTKELREAGIDLVESARKKGYQAVVILSKNEQVTAAISGEMTDSDAVYMLEMTKSDVINKVWSDQVKKAEKAETSEPQPTSPDPEPEPEWIRMPIQGKTCKISGLGPSQLRRLIVPSPANQFKPPVKAKHVTTNPKAKRGTWMINVASLRAYLVGEVEEGGS